MEFFRQFMQDMKQAYFNPSSYQQPVSMQPPIFSSNPFFQGGPANSSECNPNINLSGVPFPIRDSPIDVFRPIVSPHNSCALVDAETFCEDSTELAIITKHLDVCHTWKGLSFLQATEILFWEVAFFEALRQLIAKNLSFFKALEDDFGCVPLRESEIIERMLAFHESKVIDIFASESFRPMITRFIRTRDCFKINKDSKYGKIMILCQLNTSKPYNPNIGTGQFPGDRPEDLHKSYNAELGTSFGPEINMEIQQLADFITFDQSFTFTTEEGIQCVIMPVYHKWNSTQQTPETDITYKTSASWLLWDTFVGVFHGIVPSFLARDSDVGSCETPTGMQEMLKVMITATTIESFGGDARFETEIRVELRLRLPPHSTEDESDIRSSGPYETDQVLVDDSNQIPFSPDKRRIRQVSAALSHTSSELENWTLANREMSDRIAHRTWKLDTPRRSQKKLFNSVRRKTPKSLRKGLQLSPNTVPFPQQSNKFLPLADLLDMESVTNESHVPSQTPKQSLRGSLRQLKKKRLVSRRSQPHLSPRFHQSLKPQPRLDDSDRSGQGSANCKVRRFPEDMEQFDSVPSMSTNVNRKRYLTSQESEISSGTSVSTAPTFHGTHPCPLSPTLTNRVLSGATSSSSRKESDPIKQTLQEIPWTPDMTAKDLIEQRKLMLRQKRLARISVDSGGSFDYTPSYVSEDEDEEPEYGGVLISKVVQEDKYLVDKFLNGLSQLTWNGQSR